MELELRVAYHADGMMSCATIPPNALPVALAEMGRKARYCLETLKQLDGKGVTVLGSCSRDQIAHEMAEAELLLYPCDTISFTEGFSSTTLESMAHGCVPLLQFVDALPELYGGHVPGVQPFEAYTSDGRRHPQAFLMREKAYISKARALLTGLPVDGFTLEEWRAKGIARAADFEWRKTVPELAKFLEGDAGALPGLEA
jgi:glycosyltransferase involved in cell wall biosynthesis